MSSSKKMTNINILYGIPEPIFEDKKEANQPAELSGENAPFSFANIACSMTNVAGSQGGGRLTNTRQNSVIYDSGAGGHLTFEKNRFVGEIIPTSKKEWIIISEGEMLVVGHGTILVKGTLNGKSRNLLFNNTAFVPESDVTLVSSNILPEKGFFWNMSDNSLFIKTTGQKICEMRKHFGLHTLEFVEMPPDLPINSVHPRKQLHGYGI